MTSIFRCLKAEFLKCKHSVLLYIHILIPLLGAIIFAGYFLVSGWDVQTKVSAYLEVLAVSFPFLAGIIVGIVVQIEHQAGHYQLMLGTIPSRPATYIGKILLLIIGAIGAVVLALGVFALIYQEAPFALGLNFGKGASMGLGIAGSLIAALMITGLGDVVWRYNPWAWGVRSMDYIVLEWSQPDIFKLLSADFMSGIVIALLCSLLLFFFSIVWFCSWEGGKGND